MLLREFLRAHNLQMVEFAEQIGTTGPTVCRIAGGQVPRRALMLKIYEATGGEVTPNDLVGITARDMDQATARTNLNQQVEENES